VFFWAVAHWLVNALAFWIGSRPWAHVPFSAANFLQGIIAIGVAIAVIAGLLRRIRARRDRRLAVYGVPNRQAVSWAIGFHVLSFISDHRDRSVLLRAPRTALQRLQGAAARGALSVAPRRPEPAGNSLAPSARRSSTCFCACSLAKRAATISSRRCSAGSSSATTSWSEQTFAVVR
jgi:hypothetical protein